MKKKLTNMKEILNNLEQEIKNCREQIENFDGYDSLFYMEQRSDRMNEQITTFKDIIMKSYDELEE